MEDLSAIVGKNLVSLRKAKGLTQQQLANMLHYSDKSISKWELGYAIPSVDILKEFADFYGVTIDSLLVPMDKDKVDEIVKANDEKIDPNNANKAIILALVNISIVGICITIIISGLLMNTGRVAWYMLLWMVPACLFASTALCKAFYKNLSSVVLLSASIWTLLLAFGFHYQFFTDPPQNIWYILFIGLPVQAIIILAAMMRRNNLQK
ncbi:MAG: helix-turn-helix transcriptional regulator [Bacillota bacterium]|nr:helix-turn-helix transcriptional regulator [Bacillota bacterium]